MMGLSGLIDTLLAAKTSPRMDVLAIRNEAEIGPPGPVLQVGKIANDVRLPSNAALERLLPGAIGDLAYREGAATRAAKAELSAAARVISAVLADVHGDAGPVRGAAPAWVPGQAPNTAALAGQLSQTVSNSGLFYESHLVEFAAGLRTLAQLTQEPQARLPGMMPTVALPAEVAQVFTTSSMVGAPVVRAGQGGAEDVPALATNAKPTDGPSPADVESHPDVARVQAAYRWAEAPAAAMRAVPERTTEDIAPHRHSDVVSTATAAASKEVMHPQSVALVHQQLDLLATSIFRWSGEAWPGVPMQWSIEPEAEERDAHAGAMEAIRPWTTTVTMTLPRLGLVDVRLSLAGDDVQARLNASEADTALLLKADGAALARRFEAVGLRLHDFAVAGSERS